jgi:hypothetical protein
MRGDNARIGGPGEGGLDGVEALCHHVCRAHLVVAKAACQRGPPGKWCRVEGGPATQNVTAKARICVLQPLQDLGARVRQGTGEAMGAPHVLPDHAAAVGDEWGARAW